jgi:hypothetical protein
MQYRTDKSESIVYYVVAAVSIFVLIAYGNAGDIPPIAGFLITGVSVYIVYPNETIALIMALIVSAILRRTRFEGMDNEEPEKPEVNMDAIKNQLNELTENKNSDVPEPPKKKQAFTLSPADYSQSVPKAPTTQDMDKLSGMIDKTMKLIEMLPDGFLQNNNGV